MNILTIQTLTSQTDFAAVREMVMVPTYYQDAGKALPYKKAMSCSVYCICTMVLILSGVYDGRDPEQCKYRRQDKIAMLNQRKPL